VACVADSDDGLNLVPAPVDLDLFATHLALVEAVQRYGAGEHLGRLGDLGRLAGTHRTSRWVEFVDRYPPTLRTHDPSGRRVDEVEHHPAWHRLLQHAVRAGLTATAWEENAPVAAHVARAAAIVVWSQTETGHLDALSSTYAAVPALRTDEKLEALWLPRLASRAYESGLRVPADKLGCLAGLAVTERQGGSDLRTSTTVASEEPGGPVEGAPTYRLTGHKWFVSAPMSDLFLVLAHAPGGLTLFAVPRVLETGRRNTWRLVRLKDKLGHRSSATAEVELEDTWAVRVGEEGRGLRTLLGTTSAIRLDGVLVATGLMRHAVVRALHHARHREAFGGPLADKPLMQNVLADLALESEAATVLAMRFAAAVEAGETDLIRVGVPVAKYWLSKRAISVVAEAMECLGGNGYVEENGLARVYRDAPVAALWEGAGNVTALDVLRAMSLQPRSMEVLLGEVDRGRGADPRLDRAMDEVAGFLQAASREARRDPAAVEAGARWMVERLAVEKLAMLAAAAALNSVWPRHAELFAATRLAENHASMYGAVDLAGDDISGLLERALP